MIPGISIAVEYKSTFSNLNQLLNKKLISEQEYTLIKGKLTKDYRITSHFIGTSWLLQPKVI